MTGTEVLALPVALCFVILGLVTLVSPDRVHLTFGIRSSTVEARNEVRAVYGGFGLALGVLLALAPWIDQPTANGIYLAFAIANFGMAFGRLVSLAFERPAGFYPVWLWFGFELAAGTALVVARA